MKLGNAIVSFNRGGLHRILMTGIGLQQTLLETMAINLGRQYRASQGRQSGYGPIITQALFIVGLKCNKYSFSVLYAKKNKTGNIIIFFKTESLDNASLEL